MPYYLCTTKHSNNMQNTLVKAGMKFKMPYGDKTVYTIAEVNGGAVAVTWCKGSSRVTYAQDVAQGFINDGRWVLVVKK